MFGDAWDRFVEAVRELLKAASGERGFEPYLTLRDQAVSAMKRAAVKTELQTKWDQLAGGNAEQVAAVQLLAREVEVFPLAVELANPGLAERKNRLTRAAETIIDTVIAILGPKARVKNILIAGSALMKILRSD